MTAPDYQARIAELRAAALRVDHDGDVIGFDAAMWAQADELSASLGEPEGADLLGLMRKDGLYSAWVFYPEHVLRWQQPEAWEMCCRLYAADVAERDLTIARARAERRGGRC